jgi:hypothetical protein
MDQQAIAGHQAQGFQAVRDLFLSDFLHKLSGHPSD